MSGCIYCIDNDILKKLVTFDLFERTVKLFDASLDQIKILETAKYKFRRDWEKMKAGKSRNPEDKLINYAKTIELAESLPQISDIDLDLDLAFQLSQHDGIDQGEVILTTYVAQLLQKPNPSEAVIFTGDKNYLKALAQVEIPLIEATFTHRFWCLEQLILKDIDSYGFETIRSQIVPVGDCDKAIKAVFGSGERSTSENALLTLNDYINQLRNETDNLLHPYPNPLEPLKSLFFGSS